MMISIKIPENTTLKLEGQKLTMKQYSDKDTIYICHEIDADITNFTISHPSSWSKQQQYPDKNIKIRVDREVNVDELMNLHLETTPGFKIKWYNNDKEMIQSESTYTTYEKSYNCIFRK